MWQRYLIPIDIAESSLMSLPYKPSCFSSCTWLLYDEYSNRVSTKLQGRNPAFSPSDRIKCHRRMWAPKELAAFATPYDHAFPSAHAAVVVLQAAGAKTLRCKGQLKLRAQTRSCRASAKSVPLLHPSTLSIHV